MLTPGIAMVLAILALAVVLFITEWIRVDVVALMVLVSLALTGLVTPTQALSGFANLAVVTVWAVLILSAALARTGVAGLIGRPVLRLAGESEARLIATIMLLVGVLSGFMNDIGVAALMLPVVVDIARRGKFPGRRDGFAGGRAGAAGGDGGPVRPRRPGFPGDAQPGSGRPAGPDRAEHRPRPGRVALSLYDGGGSIGLRGVPEPRRPLGQRVGHGPGWLSLFRLYQSGHTAHAGGACCCADCVARLLAFLRAGNHC